MSLKSNVDNGQSFSKLAALLAEVTENRIVVSSVDAAVPLVDLGVSSITILTLLIAIEDSWHFEWSPDEPQSTFESLQTISEALRGTYNVLN